MHILSFNSDTVVANYGWGTVLTIMRQKFLGIELPTILFNNCHLSCIKNKKSLTNSD